MSGLLTRRNALRGSAMAMLGLGASVGLPATASAAPAISLEAEVLQAELARLSSAFRRASRELDEANDATAEVEPPEALFTRAGDVQVLWGRLSVESWASPGQRWYGEADLVEKLRSDPFRYLDGSPSKGAARRDKIVGAWDGWQAALKTADDASGYTAARERYDAAYDAYEAFRLRLVELRTTDPEVLTVKALALADLCRGNFPALDNCIVAALKRDVGAYKDALALSLARDFLGLTGTDHHGGAHV